MKVYNHFSLKLKYVMKKSKLDTDIDDFFSFLCFPQNIVLTFFCCQVFLLDVYSFSLFEFCYIFSYKPNIANP